MNMISILIIIQEYKMKICTGILTALSLATAISLTGCGSDSSSSSDSSAASVSTAQKVSVLTTYADIALANYQDALSDAQALQTAIETFQSAKDQASFDAAKAAWLTARESYGTTEAFRLSNGPIDSEDAGFMQTWGAPEGQLNAWPLDENMIDYTIPTSGDARTTGNIIDTAGMFTPSGGSAVDVTTITKTALANLNENGGDANVATGYHAIEFLLWGQDQDYNDFEADTITTGDTVAGLRPLSDYNDSSTEAARRFDYLAAASELIVDDLQAMVNAWTAGPGSYREAFLGEGTNAIATDVALKQLFSGMGVFVKSELANERLAVALLTPSEEDEHSCFSDNTHRDITLNYGGFVNILKGRYKGVSKGTSFYSLLPAADKADVDALIATIDAEIAVMNNAVASLHFDRQIISTNTTEFNNLKAIKNDLRDLGDEMVDVAAAFGISLTEDDVTDPDETEI